MLKMKKAVLIGLAAVLFAGGGAALAVNGTEDFEGMLPYMQERHPQMTDEELENRFEENGMPRGPNWNEDDEGSGMHRGPYWNEDDERNGMHRGPYWNEDDEGNGMHRDPYWNEDGGGYQMPRGPHWNEDDEGYGMRDRGDCPGQSREGGPFSDKDRGMMDRPGSGMGTEYEESE
jgi:hypothetical protein